MASKKTWRRRAKLAVSASAQRQGEIESLRGQLRAVDHILLRVELPGPSLDDWVSQVRLLLQELVKARNEKREDGFTAADLTKMKMPGNPVIPVPDPLPYPWLPKVTRSDQPDDGIYSLPTQEEIDRDRFGYLSDEPKGFA